MPRSYEKITSEDLVRLARLVAIDRESLFQRKPETGKLYGHSLFAVALCQGAALHYLDGKNGVKDFDVWSFYKAHPERPFPYRRCAKFDFGDPKFGVSEDSPHFVGRRVNHIGRSIFDPDYSDAVAVLRRYLSAANTESSSCLAKKAVILIEPFPLLGTVVWQGELPS